MHISYILFSTALSSWSSASIPPKLERGLGQTLPSYLTVCYRQSGNVGNDWFSRVRVWLDGGVVQFWRLAQQVFPRDRSILGSWECRLLLSSRNCKKLRRRGITWRRRPGTTSWTNQRLVGHCRRGRAAAAAPQSAQWLTKSAAGKY